MPLKNMLLGAFLLGAFAVVGTGLVAVTHDATADRIARNEREALLQTLHQLVDPGSHDNDLFHDVTYVTDPEHLGTANPVPVYRAREGGAPVAAVLAPIAPEGYGGPIRLMVAIDYGGTVEGVRVLNHHETPGLGDKIEAERSDWVRQFEGLSLQQPAVDDWKVRKDGGAFDQFTGATITPRAVVRSVYDTLVYYRNHRDELFARAAEDAEQAVEELELEQDEDDEEADKEESEHG